ncbi:MAG: hypothetical protein IPP15_00985 [Saprospiraceae bacterium]|uniref:Uncharacterized protein n=1 Tax=Candidatus Opimibacter skivensis TaxID=2982028 RepID=A0A9D7XLD3_9BACT|nr:hypothetical protein [Candidatus Opimibacter skivensis]
MGAASNIIAFDFEKFKNVIIPSLKEGESNLLVKNEIEFHNTFNVYGIPGFTNLNAVMQLFNADLTTCKFDKRFAADENGTYETERVFYRPTKNCWAHEDLAYLFESLIMRHCSKYFLSVGKIYTLELAIKSRDIAAQKIIDKWGQGGNIWNHGSGGFGEGILGWINDAEVAELNRLSSTIELNASFWKSNINLLQSIKALIEISAAEGLGLLYGNELRKCLVNNFQYYIILKLTGSDEDIYNGWPAFTTEMIKDFR